MRSVDHRAYTYKVTTQPVNLAVDFAALKDHLKVTDTRRDTLIRVYAKSAIDYAEKFTRRDFITRTYTTFRDFFPGFSEGYYQTFNTVSPTGLSFGGNVGFEIRRSPLQSITNIKYFVSDVLTTVDSTIFYNTLEEDYSEVLTVDSASWPDNADVRLQAIQIEFKSGFGDEDTDMPGWISEGVFNHVADMFANRGDCGISGDGTGKFLPPISRMLYLQNRIENL